MWCASTLVWHSLASARAEAQAGPFVDIHYEVDASLRDCPSASEFRKLVARKLGYDPHRPGAALGVEVRLEQSETGLSGTIDWRTAGQALVGERHFSSPQGDCLDISQTMGFVVAVQLQMMAAEPPAEVKASEADAASPSSGDSIQSAESVRTGQAPRSVIRAQRFEVERPRAASPASTRVVVGAGPSVVSGLGPEPVLLGRLFLSLEQDWRALELGTLAGLPATFRKASGGYRYQAILGTVAACGQYAPLLGCGLANLGVLRVHGIDVDRPASPQGFVAQAGLRLGCQFGLSDSLAVRAHLDGLYLLTQWAVELNREEVWSMPRLSAGAGIDLAFRFH